jgi:hypothetical protein
MGDRELGFAGMIAAGTDPAEAWGSIRAECSEPAVRAIFDDLRATADGRDALACAAAAWARHGFPPPWEWAGVARGEQVTYRAVREGVPPHRARVERVEGRGLVVVDVPPGMPLERLVTWDRLVSRVGTPRR